MAATGNVPELDSLRIAINGLPSSEAELTIPPEILEHAGLADDLPTAKRYVLTFAAWAKAQQVRGGAPDSHAMHRWLAPHMRAFDDNRHHAHQLQRMSRVCAQ